MYSCVLRDFWGVMRGSALDWELAADTLFVFVALYAGGAKQFPASRLCVKLALEMESGFDASC